MAKNNTLWIVGGGIALYLFMKNKNASQAPQGSAGIPGTAPAPPPSLATSLANLFNGGSTAAPVPVISPVIATPPTQLPVTAQMPVAVQMPIPLGAGGMAISPNAPVHDMSGKPLVFMPVMDDTNEMIHNHMMMYPGANHPGMMEGGAM